MSAFQESPIDIVIPWVDGNDPKWQREKDQYLVAGPHSSRQIGNEDEKKDVRFRDFGLFKYTIMSILRFAPWVNRVFVVTMNQELPFETGSDKVTVIDHRDFIPDPYLPTFNSNSIEMNIHRIPNLAEKFILFNDDCIFNAPVSEEDYFINNIPKDCFGLKPIAPTLGGIGAIESNDVAIINSLVQKNIVIKKQFAKLFSPKNGLFSLIETICTLPWRHFVGFQNTHLAMPYLRSEFIEFWHLEGDLLDKTCREKFRSGNDISHWAIRYLRLVKGKFVPQNISFGKYYDLSLTSLETLENELMNEKHKIVCLNDVPDMDTSKIIPFLSSLLIRKFEEG